MRPCEKCFENYWSFEKKEGFIYATCNMCGHEVSFQAKPVVLRKGCKCGSKRLILRKAKVTLGKLSKNYYYSHSWMCLDCKRFYLDNRYRIENKQQTML